MTDSEAIHLIRAAIDEVRREHSHLPKGDTTVALNTAFGGGVVAVAIAASGSSDAIQWESDRDFAPSVEKDHLAALMEVIARDQRKAAEAHTALADRMEALLAQRRG